MKIKTLLATSVLFFSLQASASTCQTLTRIANEATDHVSEVLADPTSTKAQIQDAISAAARAHMAAAFACLGEP